MKIETEILKCLRDVADFIDALHEATDGKGDIDRNSILRFGQRLNYTARHLNIKCKGLLERVDKINSLPPDSPATAAQPTNEVNG